MSKNEGGRVGNDMRGEEIIGGERGRWGNDNNMERKKGEKEKVKLDGVGNERERMGRKEKG